jgi:hypothetical protein
MNYTIRYYQVFFFFKMTTPCQYYRISKIRSDIDSMTVLIETQKIYSFVSTMILMLKQSSCKYNGYSCISYFLYTSIAHNTMPLPSFILSKSNVIIGI